MGIQTAREGNNCFLFFAEKRNCPEIRKEVVAYKFRTKTAPKFKMANSTMFNDFVLMGNLYFILLVVVNAEFMRKLFF